MFTNQLIGNRGPLVSGGTASSHVTEDRWVYFYVAPRGRRTAVLGHTDACRSAPDRAYDPLI